MSDKKVSISQNWNWQVKLFKHQQSARALTQVHLQFQRSHILALHPFNLFIISFEWMDVPRILASWTYQTEILKFMEHYGNKMITESLGREENLWINCKQHTAIKQHSQVFLILDDHRFDLFHYISMIFQQFLSASRSFWLLNPGCVFLLSAQI